MNGGLNNKTSKLKCSLLTKNPLFVNIFQTHTMNKEDNWSMIVIQTGGGRNVDDQNVDRPKISERRNGLFS
jgi:hypothetical protein